MLATLGVKHSVLHLNEGHPAFALLERIRERVEDGMALCEAVRAGPGHLGLHHPHPGAGGPRRLSLRLDRQILLRLLPHDGLEPGGLSQTGDLPHDPPGAGFNMTAFALRLSQYHNAVSQKHGEVSRRMWQPLWPDLPVEQVPIDHITNGVHVPTWVEAKISRRCNQYLEGGDWLADHDNPTVWELVDDIPDAELWALHYRHKIKLINYIREQTRQRWVEDRVGLANVVGGGALLDPSILTIGFARRFATYKRADLIFPDLERLKRLLNDPWRPSADHLRRQGPSRRRPGQADPAAHLQLRPGPGPGGPDRLRRRLRRATGPIPGSRGGRLAQQPPAAAGGLRHQRHEGRH